MQIDSQVMDSSQRHDFHILTLLCISKWLLIIWRHVVDKGAFPLNLLLVSSGDRAGCFISPGNDLVFSFTNSSQWTSNMLFKTSAHPVATQSKSVYRDLFNMWSESLFRVQTDYNLQNSHGWELQNGMPWDTWKEFLENEKQRWFVSSTYSHPQKTINSIRFITCRTSSILFNTI